MMIEAEVMSFKINLTRFVTPMWTYIASAKQVNGQYRHFNDILEEYATSTKRLKVVRFLSLGYYYYKASGWAVGRDSGYDL